MRKIIIDKDVLVAEIEKRIKETESMQPKFDQFWSGQISAFKGVLKIIDTLEVKDVDCDKEIGTYTTKELLWKRNKATNVFHLTQGDIDRIAKHFFELGLKTKKG